MSVPSPRYEKPVDLSRYAWLSIAAALSTIALKGWAAWLTGSVGLLSDAAESVVNLVAAIVALIVLKVSIRPADEGHQFGHTKAEYFSSVIEGAMIVVAALTIIVSATQRLMDLRMPEALDQGLVISVLASLINGAVAFIIYRAGKRHGSLTLVADARHLATDIVTSVAVLVGVVLVMLTHWPILDVLIAYAAGANILWTGYGLMKSSVRGLMDAAPSPEARQRIMAVLDERRVPGVIDFHAVRMREAGMWRFMDVHVLVPGAWTVTRGHDEAESLIDALVEVDPHLRVNAHVEPIEDPKSYADIADV